MKRLFTHVTLVLPNSLLPNSWLLVDGDRIADFGQDEVPTACDLMILDGGGAYLSPGFVDTHVHGGNGSDFLDGTEEAYLRILNVHLKGGTTTILPTLSSAAQDTLLQSVRTFNDLKARETTLPDIPHLAGIHLEGPYFSQAQRGAQDPNFVRDPDPAEYGALLDASPYIRRWSISCELPGAIELGRLLNERAICPSIGHSDATAEQAIAAVEAGYRCVTHLYSGCSSLHRNGPYREGGVVEAAFLLKDLDVEVIADGVHLPPLFLKLIYSIKGADRISLVTDCIRPGGTPYHEGEIAYEDLAHQHPIYLENHVAVMPDRKNFAGSIATTSQLVRTIVQDCGIDLPDAVRMAALNPARMLGLDAEIGSIERGKRADLLLLDDTLHVITYMLSGVPCSSDQALYGNMPCEDRTHPAFIEN